MQPSARHIVCVYHLPGDDVHARGYCDDGEPGAGSLILNLMSKSNIQNRVIFVTHKYGGVKMGGDRFECYLQAAKSTVMANPRNSILDIDQVIKDDKVQNDAKDGSSNKSPAPGTTPMAPMRKYEQNPLNSPRDSKNFRGKGRGYYAGGYDRKRAANNYFRGAHHHRYDGYQRSGRNIVTERYRDHRDDRESRGEWDYGSDWSHPRDRHYYENTFK